MKRLLIILLILSLIKISFSQSDSINLDKNQIDRFVFGFIPSVATNIYGIALGPVGSEAICNKPYTKYSHGLNLQLLGQGFFQIFYIKTLQFDDFHWMSDTVPKRAVHNGLLISPLGTFTDQINGVSFSLWMSMGKKINGLSFNFFWNLYEEINGVSIALVNHVTKVNGMQIGLLNKTKNLRGFQIGLWNQNEKRSLPILNWNFRNNNH